MRWPAAQAGGILQRTELLQRSKEERPGFTRQLEDNRLEFVRLKKTGICLLVGKNSPFYVLNSIEPSALQGMRLVQPDEGLYFICTRPSHKYENFFSGYDGQIVVCTNSDSVVEKILDNTDMGTVSCGRPPGRSGQGQLWAVPLNGMKDNVYFGYIKRKKDALSPTEKRFIAYLVKMLE